MSSLESLEKDEASWMLRALSKTLLQPLDSLVLQSTQSKLQVVLIMQREQKNKKNKKKKQEEEEEASSAPETGAV